MPELVAPTVRLHAAWLDAHREWGPGLHEDGFGLVDTDEVDSPAGFAAWVARLTTQEDVTVPVAPGRVHCTYRWMVEGGRVLGGIALRREPSDFVRWAGHIGYGVRPSARGRGVATWALGRILDVARELGMARVLAVCAADNVASARTLERQGGVFEEVRDTGVGPTRRYWFTL
ncbi:GNAT family N-acetyltransferase [Actinocatenispora rupis]|uniref:Acetyltransferase n=1 Tax=Actinocatenispora rupis TaxID=519421 RepID=A0A8J3J7S6_9ACTN|nr:GNAT family N-acetyltransferase [Actinocatenispora rupis]GID10963.1 acetyltransferase [Actinocatenispora rupis]